MSRPSAEASRPRIIDRAPAYAVRWPSCRPPARYPFSRTALVRRFQRRRSAFELPVAIPMDRALIRGASYYNCRHLEVFLPAAHRAKVRVDQTDDPRTQSSLLPEEKSVRPDSFQLWVRDRAVGPWMRSGGDQYAHARGHGAVARAYLPSEVSRRLRCLNL